MRLLKLRRALHDNTKMNTDEECKPCLAVDFVRTAAKLGLKKTGIFLDGSILTTDAL
jgi:hypothetical protein